MPFSTVRGRPTMWSLRRPWEVRIAAPHQVELRTKKANAVAGRILNYPSTAGTFGCAVDGV